MVFILAVAGGAGFLSLKCGCLPKEDAGQIVIEILDSPTPAEMKAHVRRITSGEVIRRAARNAGGDLPDKVRGEMQDRMHRNVEVSSEGPFITITAYDDRGSPAEMANAVATSYQEDLISETVEPRRRVAQNSMGQITLNEAATEKARLEWLELAKRHKFTPDGTSPAETVAGREIATRLAKAKVDHALAKQAETGSEGPDLELAQDKTKGIALEVTTLEAALKQHEENITHRVQSRSEMDTAKAKYERLLKLLNNLKEERMEQNVKDGVVIRPLRVMDEARPVRVTDRRIRKYVQFGVKASAVLVASFLLCALAGRLCRRGP